MEKIKVRWEVKDGYAGKSRPQTTIIDIENELMDEEEWDDLTEEEKKEHIESIVEDDFENKISFVIEDYDI